MGRVRPTIGRGAGDCRVMATRGDRRRNSALGNGAGAVAPAGPARGAGSVAARRSVATAPAVPKASSGNRRCIAGGRVVTRLPHHTQIHIQPRTEDLQTRQRPGGARNRSSKAMGPRMAPNTAHTATTRSSRVAMRPAAAPNPTPQAVRAMSGRRSIAGPPRSSTKQRRRRTVRDARSGWVSALRLSRPPNRRALERGPSPRRALDRRSPPGADPASRPGSGRSRSASARRL